MTHPQAQARPDTTLPKGDFDAVIVGAGFAGLYMLHRLRGMGFRARVLEAGSGGGGTWYWNRYPGARCDVESVQYSYQFDEALQQEWDWSERYAAQPELLRYANHVADRFDLRRDIECNTRVASAAFDEAAGRWVIEANGAARGRVLPHGKLAARGGELRGLGGSCDRHRLLGRAVDPDHRRPSPAAHPAPAHGKLCHARAQRAADRRIPGSHQGRLPGAACPRPTDHDRHRF